MDGWRREGGRGGRERDGGRGGREREGGSDDARQADSVSGGMEGRWR